MFSKTLLLSALLAASAISAAPIPAEKRCLGGCKTVNDNSSHTNTNTNTNASTTTSNTQNTSGSGNQATTGNNGGGNDFSGMSFGGGGGFSGCRRAFLEGRAENRRLHQRKVNGQHEPRNNKPWHAPPKKNIKVNTNKTTNNSINKTNTQNSNNTKVTTTNTNVNKSKSNNVDQSGNMGVINGSGNVCRREFIELEMERRELDAGASILAAMGGLTARDLDDDMEMLATRELGRLAETLGARAVGHDGDDDTFTHYKRDVGTQCATEECDMMKREVDDLLRYHARSLGFWVADDE